LYDILVLDGGRDKTMSDLVDGDRELPANTVKLDKADLNETRKARQREREREREKGGYGGKEREVGVKRGTEREECR